MYVTEHLVPRETSLIRRIDIKNVRMKAFFPSHNHICVVIARCLWSRFHASSLNRRPPFLVVDSFSRNGIRSRRLLSEKSREREREEGWHARRRTKRRRREGTSCKLPGAASSPGESRGAASLAAEGTYLPLPPCIVSREFLFIRSGYQVTSPWPTRNRERETDTDRNA